jgi:hypothetical protein
MLDGFSGSSHITEDEDENSNLQEENFNLLYMPYEDLSRTKFENEIKEPTPNEKKYFRVVIDDENPKEFWQQGELVEKMILENNDKKYFHSMKEEFFQNIVSESKFLDAVNNEENHESIIILEAPHISKTLSLLRNQEYISLNHGSKSSSMKHCNHILNIPSSFFSLVHIESGLDSLAQVSISSTDIELITKIR